MSDSWLKLPRVICQKLNLARAPSGLYVRHGHNFSGWSARSKSCPLCVTFQSISDMATTSSCHLPEVGSVQEVVMQCLLDSDVLGAKEKLKKTVKYGQLGRWTSGALHCVSAVSFSFLQPVRQKQSFAFWRHFGKLHPIGNHLCASKLLNSNFYIVLFLYLR